MGFLETISARRRGGHKLSPPPSPAYTDEDKDSATITKSHKQAYHKSKPLFYSQTVSCKVLMIGAALMLLAFPLVRKNFSAHFDLRNQTVASESSVAVEEKGGASLAADTSENVDLKVQPSPTRLNYTAELASMAVEPTVWTCGKKDRHNQTALDPITNQRPFFAFVHVYKTAGSTVRDFFTEYATICKKSLAIIQTCRGSGVEKCQLKSVNAPQKQLKRVNSAILHDHYDILGGHFSFGMADHIFSNANTTTTTTATTPHNGNNEAAQKVRHMVFLRQPMARFVSHILYQQNTRNKHQRETVQDTAEDIKKRIRSSRGKGEFMSSIYKYLLTPTQREMKYDRKGQTQEAVEAHKAQLSIDNLMRYNAIVGMTETFSQSMQIFEHAMGHVGTSARKEEEVKGLFSRFVGEEVLRNVSKRKSISTGSVLKELNKDDEFMVVFREYVKYEQMIVDFAMEMHQKQHNAVTIKPLH